MTSMRDITGGREPVIGSLCTGYGGLDLGTLAATGGGRLAWVADPDRHVRTILDARMPGVPNLGDITTTDWRHVEEVDVITAGFPCQDISAAGRGAGIREGQRSGLWHQVLAAVRDLRPAMLVVENVAALRWRGGDLGVVLGDLAGIGYDAHWCCLRASDIGAAHRRERVFLLAYPTGTRFTAVTADPAGPGSPSPDPTAAATTSPLALQPSGSDRTAAAHTASRRRPPQRYGPEGARSARASGQPDRHGPGTVPDAPGPRGCLQRSKRDQPPGRPDTDRHPRASATDPYEQQSQRRRGPAAVAPPSTGATAARYQWQRDGHAPVDRGPAAADPEGQRHRHTGPASRQQPRRSATVAGSPAAVPDTAGQPGRQRQPEPTRLPRQAHVVLGGSPAAAHAQGDQPHQPDGDPAAPLGTGPGTGDRDHPPHPAARASELAGAATELARPVDWGDYEPAIRRWETVVGRPAPHPVEPGRGGKPRLAPVFVEWLMGLDPGWVTDLDLPRSAQLRALGNGVIPQQAAHAIHLLLADLLALDADTDRKDLAA